MDQAMAYLLSEKYTAEKVMGMSPFEMCNCLINEGVIKSVPDFNLLVLEAVQRAFVDDDEFPIHFYTKDEPMSEHGRTVGKVECLTDDYIANMLEGG